MTPVLTGSKGLIMKKSIRLLFLSAITLSGAIYAQANQQDQQDGYSAIFDSINGSIAAFNKDFDNKWSDAYLPSTKTKKSSSIMYPDYLTDIQSANTFSTQAFASHNAQIATANNLANSLTRFGYELHKSTSDATSEPQALQLNAWEQTQPGEYTQIHYKKYDANNTLTRLINGVSGSDTLYMGQTQIDQDTKLSQQQKPLIKQPTNLNDSYFNFAALFEPAVYPFVKDSQEQKKNPEFEAANHYVVFAAQSTKNLAEGLNLNALKYHPAALATFISNPDYQKFAMTIRTLLGIRSITIDMLEHLIAERTPHPDWGKAIGDPNKDGTASPMQLEAYQANHRIDDPNWYNSIMNDAPITVQRTIAIELAEIEHQNYQAHLDRERILAALTAANLQSSMGSEAMLKTQIDTLNTDIQQALPQTKPLSTGNGNGGASPEFKAGTQGAKTTP